MAIFKINNSDMDLKSVELSVGKMWFKAPSFLQVVSIDSLSKNLSSENMNELIKIIESLACDESGDAYDNIADVIGVLTISDISDIFLSLTGTEEPLKND